MVPPFHAAWGSADSAYVQVAITPDRPDGCGTGSAAKFLPESQGERRAATLRPRALLAQLVEHFHGKEGVAGSSPAEGSYFFF